MTQAPQGGKSKMTAMLLCILPAFVGVHGIHSFYLGSMGKGIIQLLTCGGCGIWTLIDLIFLATGKVTTDAAGNPLT